MKKLLVLIMSLVVFSFSFAEWKYQEISEEDVQMSTETIFVKTKDNKTTFAIEAYESRAAQGLSFEIRIKENRTLKKEGSIHGQMIVVVDGGMIRRYGSLYVSKKNGETVYNVGITGIDVPFVSDFPEIIKEMKNGKELVVGIETAEVDGLIVKFPLKGFIKALNKSYMLGD